jgi:methionyl-tRNA formyltransferase
MKIVVLTTETLHHAYFVQKLSENYELASVIVETDVYTPNFDIRHEFEAIRETYEEDHFFGKQKKVIKDFAATFQIGSVNSGPAVEHIASVDPDVIVVFGTGLLKKDVLSICPDGIMNLHGGDPERYRGLDSHLWSVYHDDYSSIVCTLHRVNASLDDGAIILRTPVEMRKNMQLYELRRFNTEACITLVLSALDMFSRFGRFISTPQREKGRYYSFMPSPLKDICVRKFRNYTAGIA